MRIPSRENRIVATPSTGGEVLRRWDERVPRMATAASRNTVYQLFAEAYRDVRRADGLEESAPANDWLAEPDERSLTHRMTELLLEAKWSRVLRNHRLAEAG